MRACAALVLLMVGLLWCQSCGSSSGTGNASPSQPAPPQPPPQPPPVDVAAPHRRFVDGGGTVAGDGRSGNAAFLSLDEALAATVADPGISEIWIAEGIYVPLGGEPGATFRLTPGLKLMGGFRRGDTSPEGRDVEAHASRLAGRSPDGAFAESSRHVVTGAAGAILDGLTVEEGHARAGTDLDDSGGGLLVEGVAMSAIGCRFERNGAGSAGGGVCVVDGALTVTECDFVQNHGPDGAGIAVIRSELRAQALGDAERAAPGVLVALGAGAARNVLAPD